jgi:hypothetical protein
MTSSCYAVTDTEQKLMVMAEKLRTKLPFKVSETQQIISVMVDTRDIWRVTTQYTDISNIGSKKHPKAVQDAVTNEIIKGAKKGDTVTSCTQGSNGRKMIDAGVTIRRVIVTRELEYYGSYDIILADCIAANFK